MFFHLNNERNQYVRVVTAWHVNYNEHTLFNVFVHSILCLCEECLQLVQVSLTSKMIEVAYMYSIV